MDRKLRILELIDFSAGGCGVWGRVKQESIELSKKNHRVLVLSSNIEKGTNRIVPSNELIDKIKIKRFHAIKLGGESFMYWFGKEAMRTAIGFQPDIILAHAYRHLHTTKALKIAGELKKQGKICKVFIVTHAPFERSETRNLLGKIAVAFYDKFIGPLTLKKFDKIIRITNWEMSYLVRLGVPKEKIVYIPNGISNKFFSKIKTKEKNKALYTGRISPVKNLEVVLHALSLIQDKTLMFELLGPAEEDYLRKLNQIIKERGLSKQVLIVNKIYNQKEQIKKLDSARVFILPSKSEGMPQVLIEAMARGKIVIASSNLGAKDLIEDGKNGYLFKMGSAEELAEKLNFVLENKKKVEEVRKKATKSVEKFKWDKIIKKLEKLF